MSTKKKVDSRVRTLIENAVKSQHRSLFVIVGDHGKDQVVNLHYVLSKSQVKSKPTALWCYKKDLGFSTHRKKRMNQIKKAMARGLYDPNKEDPFELFITSTQIRWCYYKDTKKILGSTYGMVVLQDFEALTPNLLARTIETVEGGGIIILLLRTMNSLKQLYSMSMDVHTRFRTGAYGDIVPRFNERFILSLGSVKNCLLLDDKLNILPLSKHAKNIVPIAGSLGKVNVEDSAPLKELKESLAETQPIGALVETARTMDQAKAIMTFVEAISEKTLRSTVSLTAARGRGKSASMGLAIAAAVAYGYSNIFITSPSPENLNTVFDFVFKGFDALKYKDHLDYEAIQSTNPDFNKAIVRINIFRDHRQTIQYIDPSDSDRLGQAELLVIDEAAAIPLPYVRKLLGNYLVFMSSTINGYEGTGRSLSLKLLSQLRKNQHSSTSSSNSNNKKNKHKQLNEHRVLREVTLDVPIRYAEHDPIESWLNDLLCLDSTKSSYRIVSGIPHPSKCELFHVNRDSLFSYHKVSEAFLQRMMALYVSSHYKNTPNDLQMMCDAPAHELFVLLGPNAGSNGSLPDILCVLQVCKEGKISKEAIRASLARGKGAAGDLIPWVMSQQYLDNNFGSLSGARVVRIATHPDATGMGYGSRAIELLGKYYQGDIVSINENDSSEKKKNKEEKSKKNKSNSSSLTEEKIKPRKNMPPLLTPLDQRPPERLHYLGVSYGVTTKLFNFWGNAGFVPVYLRQTTNELTGEHSCIMLKPLNTEDMVSGPEAGWCNNFSSDFAKRFLFLLSSSFRKLDVQLALSMLSKCTPAISITNANKEIGANESSISKFSAFLGPLDVQRLEAYSRNLVDYRLITDLMPIMSQLYFLGKFDESFKLSALQTAILVGVGMQSHTMDAIASQLDLPTGQLLAMFNKTVRKVSLYLKRVEENEAKEELNKMNNELPNGKSATKKKKKKKKNTNNNNAKNEKTNDDEDNNSNDNDEMVGQTAVPKEFMQYAIKGNDKDWDTALSNRAQNDSARKNVVSIRSKRDHEDGNEDAEQARKKHKKSSSKKKKKKKKKY